MKLCTKWGGETSPRLFLKKSKLNISPDQQHISLRIKVAYSCFSIPVQMSNCWNILIAHFPVCSVKVVEIYLSFLMKRFLHNQKSQDKNFTILKTKKAFKLK